MAKSTALFTALLCTFIWGTTFIAQYTGMYKIGPLTFNATRFFIGFLTIIPFALLFEKKKITPLAFIIKALVGALKLFPTFNSSIDDIENGKIVIKKYFHIGIAVDTPHGLMVPKMRNANNKNINNINNEIRIISEKCRNLKIDKKEFFGGSMTVTSLGGIGGSFFTPIINYPEVAILGVGRSSKKQILFNEEFQARVMLPLSLSYDHRIIDGAEAAKFCNEIKENLGKNFAYKLAV